MTQAEAQVPAAVAPVSTGTVRASRTHKSGTRRRLERLVADAAVRVALLVFVVWTLAPVVWMIVSSLLNQVALTSVPPDLSPDSSRSTTTGVCWRPGAVWSQP